MKLEVVNENSINEAINILTNKSSYDHDEISNKIIKSSNNALIHSLMLMINQMLLTGEFLSENYKSEATVQIWRCVIFFKLPTYMYINTTFVIKIF